MKENKNNTPFKAEDVNWEELAAIGILKDELEMAGELDTLLRGERTNVIASVWYCSVWMSSWTPPFSWCGRTTLRYWKSTVSDPSDNSIQPAVSRSRSVSGNGLIFFTYDSNYSRKTECRPGDSTNRGRDGSERRVYGR